MRLHPIDIGGIRTENNVFLAPLAGYTNYPFRKICLGAGAGLTCTCLLYTSPSPRDCS